MSLKNFIMRKGKSASVDMGEGAKEEEEEGATEGGGEAGGADGEAATTAEETDDKDAAAGKKTEEEEAVEKTPAEAPVTNGENGCSNGTAEEHATHNHQEEAKTPTGDSPVKKTKEAGAKEEANAKIINATAAVNSGELEHAERDSDDGATNNRQQQQQQAPALTDAGCKQPELVAEEGEREGGEAESCDRGARQGAVDEEEEEERKRDLRDAAVAIVQNVMSAATGQLERELCVDNGLNGCYHGDI